MPVRVLAIDDEDDIRRLIRIKLEKAGFQVLTAADGEEGLEMALRELPEVVVMDVMMPGMDGFQVMARLKQALGKRAPVILLLTARSEEADVVQGLSGGADDYITKPFSPRELIERIRVTLIRKGVKDQGA